MARAVANQDFRFERKFLVEEFDLRTLELEVAHHPAHFREIFEPRWINNIYFDTPDHEYYYENVDGLPDRLKLRVRWYGHLMGPQAGSTLEFKIRRGYVGRKESRSLGPIEIRPRAVESTLRPICDAAKLSPRFRLHLQRSRPSLGNRYRRRYWISACGSFRLTMDHQLQFFRAETPDRVIADHGLRAKTVIIELKYAREHDDRASSITQRFPFRMTRSSKYVDGLDLLSLF